MMHRYATALLLFTLPAQAHEHPKDFAGGMVSGSTNSNDPIMPSTPNAIAQAVGTYAAPTRMPPQYRRNIRFPKAAHTPRRSGTSGFGYGLTLGIKLIG